MADAPPSLPIYQVPYLRLFPWLRLFRSPGSAADPKRLMLAALGLVLIQVGWAGLDGVFPGAKYGLVSKVGWLGALDEYHAGLILYSSDRPDWQVIAFRPGELVREWDLGSLVHHLTEPVWCVTMPFVWVFNPSADARTFAHSALAGLWAVVVWGLLGGAIARVAVVDLTQGKKVDLTESLRFAGRKAVPLLGSPLVPLLGVVVVAALVGAFGLIYRLPGDFGQVAAGVMAFLPLVGGLVMTMILIGLAVGWPLMGASVAAEAEDGFDAMSRSYAYVHQRPWHYLFYVLLAAGLGCLGLWFVDLFAGLVVRLSAWALAFGGPSGAVRALYLPEPGGAAVSSTATAVHGFWLGLVALLVRGWVYSYFWTVAAATYLLLRRDVDGTPWNAIAYQGRPNPLLDAFGEGAEATTSAFPASHSADVRDAGEVTGV